MIAAAAAEGRVSFRRAEPVMGTIVSFDLRPQGLAGEQTRWALREGCAVLHGADACFSLYRDDSPLSRIRAGVLAVDDAPAEIGEVLEACRRVRDLSDGWFDPWALGGGVDPTGLVKGWAAVRALRVLERAGVGAAMINAAGDVAMYGRPALDRLWQIGVRTPESAHVLSCVVAVGGAVATSGQYERGRTFWIRGPGGQRAPRGRRRCVVLT